MFDLWGELPRKKRCTSLPTIEKAWESDWKAIGDDMRRAICWNEWKLDDMKRAIKIREAGMSEEDRVHLWWDRNADLMRAAIYVVKELLAQPEEVRSRVAESAPSIHVMIAAYYEREDALK